jgi:hypothetical protein
MKLTRLEGLELALILASAPALWLASVELSWQPKLGTLLCDLAAVMLGQGLLRDLALLLRRRRAEGPPPPRAAEACLCVESTLGLLLLGAGALLLLGGLSEAVEVGQSGLGLGLPVFLLFGFAIKDYVLILRKDPDHANMIVGFGA